MKSTKKSTLTSFLVPPLVAIPLFVNKGIAQTTTTYQEKELPVLPTLEQQPDLTGLWYHINEKQVSLANAEFERLRAEYPAWRAPNDVITELNRINGRLNAASTEDSPTKSNTAPLPAKLKSKPEPPTAEYLLEQFAQLKPAARQKTSENKLAQLGDLANTVGRSDFHLLIGWTSVDKGLFNLAQEQFNNALNTTSLQVERESAQQGLQSITTTEVQQALAAKNIALLKQYIGEVQKHELEQELEQNKALAREIVLGSAWEYFDEKDYTYAHTLFSLLQHQEGQYLSLTAQNLNNEAFELACSINTEVFLRRCADGLAERQASLYSQGAFQDSVNAGKQLQQIRPLTLEEYALLGWAAREYQDVKTATDAFSYALSKDPENTVYANELVKLHAGNEDKLSELAAEFSAVKAIQQQQITQTAWPRKQFLLAYLNGDSRSTTAQAKDALQVVYGANTRSRSGLVGLGRFDVHSHYIGVGSEFNDWLWQVTFDYKQFYSGAPFVGDWFGDQQLPALNNTTSRPDFSGITGFEDTGIRAEASYQQEDYNFYVNLEYGMFDQPVDAALTGQVSLTKFLDKTTLAATAFRLPKQDSLLSNTGTFNNRHADAWGYVLEDGVRVLAAHAVAPKWSVAGTAQVSRLTGDRVIDNNALSVRMDVSYDIASQVSPKLDYWRVGPFISYNGYDNNVSGFTYGNGGYFSPSMFLSVGAYSELLTLEAQQWQVRLRTTLAVSRVEQDDDLRFPFNDFALNDEDLVTTLGEDNNTGLSGNIMAEGQYRLSDNWIVAGYMGKSFAVEFEEIEAGIQIRWRAGKGNGVTSDELILSSPRLSGFAL